MEKSHLHRESQLLYAIIFWLLINRPLCFFLGLPTPLLIIVCLVFYLEYLRVNSLFRHIALSKQVFVWAILMLYHFCNALYCNVPETDYQVLSNCIQTSILLAFTAFAYVRNSEKCLKTLVWGFLAFLVLCLAMGSFDIQKEGRLSTLGIHTNQIGQCAGMLSLVAALTYGKGGKKERLFLSLIFVFVIVVCLLTQSRNAFGVVAFGLLSFFYPIIRKMKWQYVTLIILVLCFFAPFMSSYVTESSYIANLPITQRFIEKSDDDMIARYYENYDIEGTGTFLDNFLGERIIYYILGWSDFIENPIHGIGLWQFKNIHFGYPIHSEYIVHLAEGGIIGFALFCTFLWGMIGGLLKAKDSIKEKLPYFITLAAILFLSITARLFVCEYIFPVYGCILGYILRFKYNRNRQGGYCGSSSAVARRSLKKRPYRTPFA